MRPIKLTINAFGSYLKLAEIDFDRLGEYHLFLINGATGSGKTTIFDALVYALYGEVSGSSRNQREVKSQYATDQDLSYVELEFEVRGKIYRIYRQPAQQGPGARGGVRQYPSPEVTLYLPNGTVVTRTKEVARWIQDLIGLTKQQFSQIVMLPQGEFKKLLEADSKEKETIFRHIFHTESLYAFQQIIKNKANTLDLNLKRSKQDIERYSQKLGELFVNKENVPLSTVELLGQAHKQLNTIKEKELKRCQEKIVEIKAKIEGLTTLITLMTEREEAENVCNELREIYKTIAPKAIQLQQYEETQAIYHTHQLCHQVINQLEEKEALLQKITLQKNQNQTAIKKWQKEIESDQDEWQRLSEYEEEYEVLKIQCYQWTQYNRLLNQIEGLKQQQHQLSQAVIGIRSKETQIKEKKREVEQCCEKMHRLLETLGDLDKEMIELTQETQVVEMRRRWVTLYQQVQGERKEREKQRDQAKQYLSEKQCEEKEAQFYYYKSMVATLAMELKKEHPCPVCGSTTHPHPAQAEEGPHITKQELDAIHSKTQQSQQLVTQFDTQCQELMTQQREYEAQLGLSGESEMTIVATITQEEQSILQKKQQLDTKKRQYKDAQVAMNHNQEEMNELQKKLEKSATQKVEIETTLKSLEKQLEQQQETAATYYKQLKNKTEEDNRTALARLEERITDIKKNHQNLIEQQQILDKEAAQLKGKEDTIHQDIVTLSQSKENYQQQLKQLLNQTEIALSTVIALHQSDTDWATLKKQLINYEKRAYQNEQTRQQLEEQLSEYTVAADVATYQEQKNTQQILLDEALETQQQWLTLLTQLEDRTAQLEEAHLNYQSETQEFGELKQLSDVANGQMNQSQRISFERYVLAMYFDLMIERANQRYFKMTNGQYYFERQETVIGGTQAKGLELAVYDTFTAKKRSVRSLSGGESFQAALAFALGLSDVIQEQAGGIEVGTLFIDEGFGSLDAQTRQTAIDTLVTLQQQSGRLIGIISHVEELKQQLPYHLNVRKTAAGSTVNFSEIKGL